MDTIKTISPPDFAVNGRDAVEVIELAGIRMGDNVVVNSRYLTCYSHSFANALAKTFKERSVQSVIIPNGETEWIQLFCQYLKEYEVNHYTMSVDNFKKIQAENSYYQI